MDVIAACRKANGDKQVKVAIEDTARSEQAWRCAIFSCRFGFSVRAVFFGLARSQRMSQSNPTILLR